MPEIGATLREARMRARIDVSEIEAQTKIRAKYLRALENEEWGLLPGSTFVKSFLRTYAQALGLDGKALVEEYRLHHEHPTDTALEPIVATPRRQRGGGRGVRGGRERGGRDPDQGPSRGYMLAVGAIGAVIVLLIVLLISGGGSSPSTTSTAKGPAKQGSGAKQGTSKAAGTRTTAPAPAIVSLALRPTSVVYVCLLGDKGRKLIPGLELKPGETTSTYHARHFEITLGNSAVTILIDGRERSVPPSSEAIGYSITKARGRKTLAASQRPTCK
jgi:cytoskeleton protein RodZ